MSDCECGQCRLRRAREAVELGPSSRDHWNDPRPRAPLTTHECLGLMGWTPPAGTEALLMAGVPDGLHHAVRTMAYVVCRIEAAGPTGRLVFPDVDDHGHITDALERAGLIETHSTAGGVTRWERRTQGGTRR